MRNENKGGQRTLMMRIIIVVVMGDIGRRRESAVRTISYMSYREVLAVVCLVTAFNV